MVGLIIERGANPFVESKLGTALYMVAKLGHEQIALYFLQLAVKHHSTLARFLRTEAYGQIYNIKFFD